MTTLLYSGKTYGIYQFTGPAVDNNKQRELGTWRWWCNLYIRTGRRQLCNSSTTIHDQFFLMDDNGQEHDVTLSNWNVTYAQVIAFK